MGIFGYRNFENDSGLDFEDDFIEAPTPATIRLALLPIVRTVAEGGLLNTMRHVWRWQLLKS